MASLSQLFDRASVWRERHDAALRRSLIGLALLCALLPVALAKYMPFCDMYGNMGVVGAYLHRGDPVKLVDPFYSFRATPTPTAGYLTFVYLLGHLLPVIWANNLFIALFVILAPPLAMAYTLRSFGRSPWLALLTFPMLYHRQLWYGFMGSTASVPLTILLLGLANDVSLGRRLRGTAPAMALTSLCLAAAQTFQGLIGHGLAVLVIALAPRQPVLNQDGTPDSAPSAGRRWLALGMLVPGALYLVNWLGGAFGSGAGALRAGSGSSLQRVLAALRELWLRRSNPSVAELREWFVEGVKVTRLDDALGMVAAASVGLFVLFGIRSATAEAQRGRRDLRPWLLLVLVSGMYVFMPMKVYQPIYWWAIRVRWIVPAYLLAILCIRSSPRGLPRILLAPALVTAMAWFLWLANDLRSYFNGVQLAQFDALLDAIPPGQRVMLLLPRFEGEDHYEHFPYAYFLTNYTARSGGLAYPLMDGSHKELWTSYYRINGPNWGMAEFFRWQLHNQGWDYFVVKDSPGRRTPALYDAPPGALEPMGTFGLWRLYHKLKRDPFPVPIYRY